MLRQWMRREGVAAFITPSTDPHSGEYVPDHWKGREWISGFNGSAGTAVVTLEDAALWTDNRYFLAAAEQLEGTPFCLQKLGLEDTPSIATWLKTLSDTAKGEEKNNQNANTLLPSMGNGLRVGFDPECFAQTEAEQLMKELANFGLQLVPTADPYAEIWTDRPVIPENPVELHPLEYAGESVISKQNRMREATMRQGADALVVSMLDEVAWALNLRGTDVQYNPVFVSYLLVGQESATLYINKVKLSSEVEQYLAANGIGIKPYDAIFEDLAKGSQKVLVQPEKTNYRVCSSLGDRRVNGVCPATEMKIMKNDTEISGYRSAMIKDGVAMVMWMKWALEAIPKGGQTELSLSRRLFGFRSMQPLFRGDSFETIMGYAAHAAIVHYEPSEVTDIPVEPHGLLLCDSGGQYLDGTTDVTRTLPLGELTAVERRDYTLCLRGWINLARAVFPRGTYGTQLDALAREPMWKYGINYLHGTGHGVGSFLNVHEGPHQFRMNYMPQMLVPTMTITCEPGIYIAGSHGVRHENTMLVVDADLRECADSQGITFGPYYQFEQLTLCPIITSPIMLSLLQSEEIEWFNAYQQMVYDRLAPHLDEEHRQWLFNVTRPI